MLAYFVKRPLILFPISKAVALNGKLIVVPKKSIPYDQDVGNTAKAKLNSVGLYSCISYVFILTGNPQPQPQLFFWSIFNRQLYADIEDTTESQSHKKFTPHIIQEVFLPSQTRCTNSGTSIVSLKIPLNLIAHLLYCAGSSGVPAILSKYAKALAND
ncbi:MAG: hypothetical protein EWM50_07155 [Gottschalkiaceae bacterium]|nr:MAG: hypothetical protein EWM50_07155 [Gottschalkiaceae bacterium]